MKISNAFRRLFHRKTLLFKVLLSYIIVGSILLSVLSYVMYIKYSENSIAEIDKVSERMLMQSYNVTNSYWSSTVDYLGHLYYNSSNTLIINNDMNRTSAPLFNALYSNVFDPIERGDITNKLIEISNSNPLIESVYVYNRQSDTIFSSITVPLSINEFFDKSIVDILNNSNLTHEMEYIPRKVKYTYAAKNTEYNSISVVFSDGSSSKKPDCALVFNLRQDVLQQMVTSGTTDSTTEIFIINQDGMVISHPDSKLVNSNMKPAEYIDRILKSSQKSGSFTTTINNKKALVKFRKSDNIFKWVFISKSDYQLLLQYTRELQKNILIITLIFIVLSILIALVFTRNLYIPLYRILRKLPEGVKVSNEGRMNEYDMLSNSFDSLMDNVRSSMPFIKKEVLKQIIAGETVSEKEINKSIKDLKIQLSSEFFTTALIKMEDFKNLRKRLNQNDIALMRFAILNIASETLEGTFISEGLEIEQDSVVLIVSLEDTDAQTISKLSENLVEVHNNIRQYLKIDTAIVIGSFCEGISSIQYSYKNALLAYDYRIAAEKAGVLNFNDLKSLVNRPYEYPFEMEKQILDSMKVMDDNLLNDLVQNFMKAVRWFSYDEMLASMTQLALAAARTVKVITGVETEEINMSYKAIHQQLREYNDIAELENWLIEFMEKIAKSVKEAKSNKYEGIAQRILEYIEANYQNSTISVEEIAERVNLSPNYTRTIFKDKTGKSISNYITELRFSKAAELLKNTHDPANRIAEMVGFQNSAYFYVAFKKYTGKTPEEYRKEE